VDILLCFAVTLHMYMVHGQEYGIPKICYRKDFK